MGSGEALQYRFKKRRWVLLFILLDLVGGMLRKALAVCFPFWRRRPPPPRMKVLVVRLDHIGDVLLSTPALAWLRTHFPEAHITVLVGPWAAEVLQGNPCIDDLQVFRAPWFDRSGTRQPTIAALYWEAKKLRAQKFDLGVDLRGDFRNIVLLALSGIPYRLGYADAGGGFFLNRVVSRKKYQHEVYRSLDVVRALRKNSSDNETAANPGRGYGISGQQIEKPRSCCWTSSKPAVDSGVSAFPDFALEASTRSSVGARLARDGIHDGTPLVAFHPGSGCSSKLWDSAKFAEVADALAEQRQVGLVFTGSEGERELVADITCRLHAPVLDLCGQLTLKELGALFERCAVVVTVDGGAMHIAAAVGAPVVSAFCSMTTLAEWGPFGGSHIAVRHDVPCGGCELSACPKPVRCMDLITAEEIFQAAACLFEYGHEGGNRSKR